MVSAPAVTDASHGEYIPTRREFNFPRRKKYFSFFITAAAEISRFCWCKAIHSGGDES
jgi:hypothetical protein